MKFPSFNHLANSGLSSLKRFYLTIMFAIAGTIACVIMVEAKHDRDNIALIKLIHSCILGISCSIGFRLYAERRGIPMLKWLGVVVCAILITAYYFLLAPSEFFEGAKEMLIFFVLFVVLHFWIAVSPYLNINETNGFWRFNETLYARVIMSALFSLALFAGLALALFALKTLLKFDISDNAYPKLWFYIWGIFNTWFVVAGIPKDFKEINTEKPFPKGLKIFSQYILIPLATIYALILYSYGFKILGEWNLPKGWVSMLIMCYAVVGILALLLVNPLRESAENSWIRIFSRFFYIAQLPLIVLLFVAVGARVKQYGITELRYYLIVLGGWLFFMALYFIFSRRKNIKFIPASLMIVGLLTLFGRWGAFSVSEKSQLSRFKQLLTSTTNWQPNNKVFTLKQGKTINRRDHEEMAAIISYFVKHNNSEALQEIYPVNIKQLKQSVKRQAEKSEDMYTARWQFQRTMEDTLQTLANMKNSNDHWDYSVYEEYAIKEKSALDIAGYTKIYNYYYENYSSEPDKETIHISNKDSLEILLADEVLSIKRDAATIARLDIGPIHEKLRNKNQSITMRTKLEPGEMTFETNNGPQVQIILRELKYRAAARQSSIKSLTGLNASVLFK